jgi:hypothetical protein
MKSFKLIIMLAVASSTLFQSCRKGSVWGIRGEGSSINETKNLRGFNAIRLAIDVNVAFTKVISELKRHGGQTREPEPPKNGTDSS